MRRYRTALLALAATFSLAACSAPSETAAEERDDDALTSEDIAAFAATNGGATAYDLVNQRRRFWLTTRRAGDSDTPVVYNGPNRLGTAEALRRIDLAQIERIEYLNPRVARNRYGVGNHPIGAGGAILVSLREGRRHTRSPVAPLAAAVGT